ncbi:MAG: hypothetical protein DRJ67_07150 [Thermoprotei archaeon]|nr:MAG: hypothetical protein DRJ67_07150 [Thermoprotei archaeon]
MAPLFRVVDSGVEVSPDLQLYCLDGTWTYPHVPDVPVLLVSPETMDEACPPERRTGINPEHAERLREAAESVWRSLREYRLKGRVDAWRRAQGEFWSFVRECEESYAACGVFLERCKELEVKGPVILICPERIMESARDSAKALGIYEEEAFRHLLKATVIHEQVHAYAWRRSRGATYRSYNRDPRARVVEEFITQYTAWSHLSKKGRILLAHQAETQPLEYRTWRLMTAARHPHKLRSFILAYIWSSGRIDVVSEPLRPYLDEILVYYRLLYLIPPWRIYTYLLSRQQIDKLEQILSDLAFALLTTVL